MKSKTKTILLAFYDYMIFFLLIAFFISCSMILFLNLMQNQMQIELTQANIETAAKLTFGNVLFLAFVCATVDRLRRKFLIEKQTERISEAAEQLANGDFSVRIEPLNELLDRGQFNRIIDCFNTMAKELEGMQSLRSDFIADVSHEIKTPLAVMQNFSTLLDSPELTDEQRRHYTAAIAHSAESMGTMVSNILKLNKLENSHILHRSSPYDLAEQLCECLLLFEQPIREKNLNIQIDLQPDVFITEEKELMELVWNNLFSNAVKFTPENGMIKVKLKTENHNICVSVSDTGCGIAPQTGKHIFDKFYQGDTSHAKQGNGLGLALVKRIIDMTENKITVNSTLGKGSTFTVTIRGKEENEQ